MSYQLSSEQWNQLLSLLSLDGILPFYEKMSVPVKGKLLFQEKLREVIVEARKEFDRFPDLIPSVDAMLFRRLSNAEAESLRHWAYHAFLGYHADQPDWFAWDIAFSQWAYSRPEDLNLLPESKRDWIVATYRQEAITEDLKK